MAVAYNGAVFVADFGNHRIVEFDTKRVAEPEPVTIKVALGTAIKKGSETVYLPALRGKLVAVSFVTDKGEKLAKSIDVLEARR